MLEMCNLKCSCRCWSREQKTNAILPILGACSSNNPHEKIASQVGAARGIAFEGLLEFTAQLLGWFTRLGEEDRIGNAGSSGSVDGVDEFCEDEDGGVYIGGEWAAGLNRGFLRAKHK